VKSILLPLKTVLDDVGYPSELIRLLCQIMNVLLRSSTLYSMMPCPRNICDALAAGNIIAIPELTTGLAE
jgi:hypothetical protein